jgi:DNA primase
MLVVVEGYMDAIACQRAGIAGVAPMGTALTEEQMEMLWRHHPEPTLCFDGDRAGMQAASRAVDRALPLIRPGKSFRFSVVEGGKDPDEVLREQGAAALRQQLANTTSFVDAVFRREQSAEPLDTPERRAGLKARLRGVAGQITDKDLAQAYREALLERFDALSPRPKAQPPFRRTERRGGRWRNEPAFAEGPPTAEGRAAAKRLAADPEPLPAALTKYGMTDPTVLEGHLEEDFPAQGFGDPKLAKLCREIIRVRLDTDHLDSGVLARHLASCGFSTLLIDIDRAATTSGAPFLGTDVSLEAARSQWLVGYSALVRLAALEESFDAAKRDLGGEGDGAATLMRLKAERDALRRAIRTGTIWGESEP